MHQSLQVVTASTCEPLTLDEAKEWLRLGKDQSADEPIIETLVTAARKKVEAITQRFFYQTSVALWVDEFPDGDVLALPSSPLVSVSAVTSYDSTDGATVMSTSDYTVDTYSEPGRIALRGTGAWPTSLREINGGVVAFTAGYTTSTGSGSTGLTADCAPMVSAVKLLLAHWYENRQSVNIGNIVNIIPLGVDYLLSGHVSPEVEG
jgi:uncharacterized phiE125 gp8 family phage protein